MNRRDPYQEGVLKVIWERILRHLVEQKPDQYSLVNWLEMQFGVNDRVITRYLANDDFEMPGLAWLAVHVKSSGNEVNRLVRAKNEVWVRAERSVFHVELVTANQNTTFTLTESEFDSILPKLMEQKFKYIRGY